MATDTSSICQMTALRRCGEEGRGRSTSSALLHAALPCTSCVAVSVAPHHESTARESSGLQAGSHQVPTRQGSWPHRGLAKL